MILSHKYLLHFPQSATQTPIISRLVKEFDLDVNIFRAMVTAEGEGRLVLDIHGEDKAIRLAIKELTAIGVKVAAADTGLVRDPSLCNHCGNCVVHCKPRALHIADEHTRRVEFDEKLCIACGKCVDNCPMKACSAVF